MQDFICVWLMQREVGFLPPVIPKERTEVGGAKTLQEKEGAVKVNAN
jgi:hypothetical protein